MHFKERGTAPTPQQVTDGENPQYLSGLIFDSHVRQPAYLQIAVMTNEATFLFERL